MFTCSLCDEETCFIFPLCDKCQKIKDIIKLYGKERILEKLETIYIVQKPKQEQKKN